MQKVVCMGREKCTGSYLLLLLPLLPQTVFFYKPKSLSHCGKGSKSWRTVKEWKLSIHGSRQVTIFDLKPYADRRICLFLGQGE
jgi:hypothetical protein